MAQNQLLEKVRKIPLAYQQEVEDFIDFILTKKRVPNELDMVVYLTADSGGKSGVTWF